MRTIMAAALAAASLVSVAASAAPYVTASNTYTGLGQQPGGDGISDQLALTSVTGDITGPGTYDANGATFTVGYTGPDFANDSGTLTNTVLFGGQTITYFIDYALDVGDSDTLTLGGNSAVYDGFLVTLNTLTLTAPLNGVATGTLTATISPAAGAVPEPASWAMMVGGFGLVGAGMRRRTARMVQAV